MITLNLVNQLRNRVSFIILGYIAKIFVETRFLNLWESRVRHCPPIHF